MHTHTFSPLSSTCSQLGPLCHTRMTSPKMTGREFVIKANMIQPFDFWVTWKTFTSTVSVRKPSKTNVDLELNGLMRKNVVLKLGCETEEVLLLVTIRSTTNPTAIESNCLFSYIFT